MEAASTDNLFAKFAARGFRLTKQRRLLLKIIQSESSYLDAGSLLRLAQAQDAGIDRTTVYRTLDLLKKIRVSDDSGSVRVSEGSRRNNEEVRVVCLRCRAIARISPSLFQRLKHEIEAYLEFRVGAVRVEVDGWCADCAGSVERKDGRV